MSADFFQTRMGQKFYTSDVPRIAKALEDIAEELKRANDLKEAEAGKKDPVAEALQHWPKKGDSS